MINEFSKLPGDGVNAINFENRIDTYFGRRGHVSKDVGQINVQRDIRSAIGFLVLLPSWVYEIIGTWG